MSELNLEVKLIATPWLSPSLLDNYYTKEQVGDLKDYVKEVEDPSPNIIYGRREVEGKMEWVPAAVIGDNFLYYGNTQNSEVTAADLSLLSYKAYADETEFVEVAINMSTAGYIQFCLTSDINYVQNIGSLVYIQPLTKQGSLPVQIGDYSYTLNCYHTPKLIAGTYVFKIYFKKDGGAL